MKIMKWGTVEITESGASWKGWEFESDRADDSFNSYFQGYADAIRRSMGVPTAAEKRD